MSVDTVSNSMGFEHFLLSNRLLLANLIIKCQPGIGKFHKVSKEDSVGGSELQHSHCAAPLLFL
jgi:hypothetical protein